MTPEQMAEEERIFWVKVYLGVITSRNYTTALSATLADEALVKYKERFSKVV